MEYVGKKVMHKAYGEGTIVKQVANHVYVQFSTKPDPVAFVAPDAFKNFLHLMDADAAQAAAAANAEKDQEKKIEQDKKKYQQALQIMQSKKGSHGAKKAGPTTHGCITADAFFDAQQKALVTEIMYLKNHGGKHIKILNGVLIDQKKGIFIYCFESDSELNYPDGTQITLWYGSSSIAATIIGIDELILYIASEENLGQEVHSIEFSAEPWRLLNFLTQRLSKLREAPSPIVKALIEDGSKRIQFGKPITAGQENAARMALSQPITFIWGPPGTGKTWTLAKIALAHMAANRRVLMLSYSNVSVDGATQRVFDMDNSPKPGRIVRYGYPRDKKLLAHPYLSSYNLAISKYPDLLNERNKLVAEKAKLNKNDKKVLEINARLKKIRERLAFEEAQAVRHAAFVSTTVSKAIADKVL